MDSEQRLDTLLEHIIKQIRCEMGKHDLSVAKLADASGVSPVQIYRYLKKETPFSLGNLVKLAEALDLTLVVDLQSMRYFS